ncbi:MAG: TOMM precursor leader peptide-binding protein [Nitrospina sp.]|nr:TOMM precursor leader peptide-binding protein [Nitrospina sp.]
MSDKFNPRIKRPFNVILHSADEVELRVGSWNPVSFNITDDQKTGRVSRFIEALDGKDTPKKIGDDIGMSTEEVDNLIEQLRILDVLEEEPLTALDHYLDQNLPTLRTWGVPDLPKSVIIISDLPEREEIAERLSASLKDISINVLADDSSLNHILRTGEDEWIHDQLKFEDVVHQFELWKDSFILFFDHTANPLTRRKLNRIALALKFPWLSAVMDGPFLLIGPLAVPDETPCFECLEKRILMNLSDPAGYINYKNALANGVARSLDWSPQPMLTQLLSAHVGIEALNYLVTGNSFLRGRMLSIYLPSMEFVYHQILQIPQCAGCGSLSVRQERETYFDIDSLI